jgi:hypothetical protein
MSRRHRLDAGYERVLGIALGISLIVHGAVLALGQLKIQTYGSENKPLVVVDLADPRPVDNEAETEAPNADASIEWPALAALAPSPARLTRVELSEYRMVLARTDVRSPLVPRPRATPLIVESGLTPVRIARSHRQAKRGASDSGSPRGTGIIFTSGPPGSCAPGSGPLASLPNRAGLISLRR